MFGDIQVPTGLGFSPDGTTLHFCDSPTRRLMAYAIDPATAALGPPRLFAESPPPGNPDGAVTAADGCLWVAHFDGARLTRFTPDGHIDRIVPLPVPRPTACCFGGDGLDTLCVTSACINMINMTEAALREAPLSGSVFAIRPGVRGLPEPVFAQGEL
jgi:sugar lactone lactonase YvrE